MSYSGLRATALVGAAGGVLLAATTGLGGQTHTGLASQDGLHWWRTVARGKYTSYQFTADAAYLVIQSAGDAGRAGQLYSYALESGEVVSLHPDIVPLQNNSFKLIDARRVLFAADPDEDGRTELFATNVEGAPPVKLNRALPPGGRVRAFDASLETDRAVYLASADRPETIELYSVPLAGGTSIKLNPDLTGAGIYEFVIDPVRWRAVYRQFEGSGMQLYSAPATGASFVNLSPAGAEWVESAVVVPHRGHVVYLARQAGSTRFEVYGIESHGGVPRKRSHSLALEETVTGLAASPTGGQIVYSTSGGPSGDALYRADAIDGPPERFTEVAARGFGAVDWLISPDGERAVYTYLASATDQWKVLSARITGGGFDQREVATVPSHRDLLGFSISPDSRWVMIIDREAPDGRARFAIRPIRGGPEHIVIFGEATFTPDGRQLLHVVTLNDRSDIVARDVETNAAVNLTESGAGEHARRPVVSADSRWIAYTVEFDSGDWELRLSDGTAPEVASATPTATATDSPTETPTVTPSVYESPTPSATVTAWTATATVGPPDPTQTEAATGTVGTPTTPPTQPTKHTPSPTAPTYRAYTPRVQVTRP